MMRLQKSGLIILLWLSSWGLAGAAVTVEPPNWWAGMRAEHLQLMVHGEDIGLVDKVTVSGKGVDLIAWQPGDSQNYVFVDLRLSSELKASTARIQFWRNKELVEEVPYSFYPRKPGSAQRQGFSSRDVIYLITPDRFANGDLANDEMPGYEEGVRRDLPGGRHGGDIAGVIQHLDYIARMGFTQIWLNPVLENAQPEYSYHGYSTTNFYQIDPRMGSNAQYQALSRQAAERGIGLIMDVVLNHAGSGHEWLQDLPFADWINFNGNFSPTSHRRETLRDPHAANTDKKQFSDGWFVPSMPDLNQRNPYLANYLIQNTIWWIEYAELSGLRIDTYSYSDTGFLSEWGRRVMNEYPNFNIVGEEWSVNPAVVAYWQKGADNFDGYQSYAPSLFDFPWQAAMVSALNNPEAWGSGMVELYEVISNDFLYADPFNLVIFADNHDMSRIYTQVDHDLERWKMAMVLTLTMRGIPQVYYGTEILMSNPGTEDHGVIRTDFPGGWPADDINGFTGKGLSEKQRNAKNFLQKLLLWRQSSQAVQQGKMMHFVPEGGVYVYFRYLSGSDDTVMVVINHNAEPVTIQLDRFAERTHGFAQARSVLTGQTQPLSDSWTLTPMSAEVYELKR